MAPYLQLLVLLTLQVLLTPALMGQLLELPQRFDHISNEDGLSQGMVYTIYQDQQGFLWLGTKDGLNRFDGYEFKVFRHDPFDSTTISGNYIKTIFEDKHGSLWIGTDDGLDRYDAVQESFIHFTADEGLCSNGITSIAEDKLQNLPANEQVLWVGTSAGLSRLKIQWTKIKARLNAVENVQIDCYASGSELFSEFKDNHIQHLAFDKHHQLWVATERSLGRIKIKDKKPVAHLIPNLEKGVSGLPSTRYCNFMTGPDQRFWIATEHSISTPILTEDDSVSFNNYAFPSNVPQALGVRSLSFDRLGQIWCAFHKGGVQIFNPRTDEFTSLEERFGIAGSYSPEIITNVYCDRSDNIWFGTSGFGVYKYNFRQDQFHNVTNINAKESPPKVSYVAGFEDYPLAERQMIVEMGDIRIYDKNKNAILPVDLPLKDKGEVKYHMLSNNKMLVIDLDKDEHWLYDLDSKERQLIRKSPEHRVLHHESVVEGKGGQLYFIEYQNRTATEEPGFYLLNWNPEQDTINEFILKGPGTTYLSSSFLRAHIDKQGILWYPNLDGLVRIDPSLQKVKVYRHEPDNAESLNNHKIKMVCPDPLFPAKYLWLGTSGGGVNRFDLKRKSFIAYGEKDGLANNVVYGILPDHNGHLWMSTNMGIAHMVLDSNRLLKYFQNYNVSDGLPGNEFNTLAYHTDEEGALYFGGIDGFVWFYPDSLTFDSLESNIVFTDLIINYKVASHKNPDSPLKASITNTKEVILSHEQNAIAFKFALLNFASASKNEYVYQLEPFDKGWQYVGDSRKAVYTNLDPGEYVFRVKALKPDGEWRDQEATLNLTIRPPWWLTRWAYMLFIALGLGALFWIRHYELERRHLRQQAAVERARAEEKRRQAEKIAAQAKELEETLKALQQKNEEITTTQQKLVSQDQLATLGQLAAGIAHEIKTPLNFVNNFSEISTELADELEELLLKYKPAIEGDDFEAMHEILNDIRQNGEDIFSNGQRANNIIRNIMDHSRGTEAQRKAVDLNQLIDENVKLAYHGYRAIDPYFNIAIHKDYDATLPLTPVIPSDLGRVLLNILNNACYATRQKQKELDGLYKPELHVSTKMCNDRASIKIRDNGPGIPQEVLDKIFLPFFTTKPSGEGNTGLGLSISREIIEEKHGGELKVNSELGNYTLFEIILPFEPASKT